MYMKKQLTLTGLMLLALACNAQKPVGTLIESPQSPGWELSSWISAKDAQVVTGRVVDGTRAADGASWFVSNPRNSKKVKKAVWMTSALGTYELYVNGQLVGNEVLKPGFTHYVKTKIVYTYDITKAFNKGAGQENELAVQVTPGWWADKIVTPGPCAWVMTWGFRRISTGQSTTGTRWLSSAAMKSSIN